MGLNQKRQRFVAEYLTDGNGTQAAIRAGYSARSAKVIASQLLTFADVRAALQAAQQQAHDTAGVTLAQIATELAAIGFAEVGEPVKLSHKLKALELLTKHLTLEELEKRLAAVEQSLAQGRNGHGLHV
jgi:phage terminase small subunit